MRSEMRASKTVDTDSASGDKEDFVHRRQRIAENDEHLAATEPIARDAGENLDEDAVASAIPSIKPTDAALAPTTVTRNTGNRP